MAGHIRRLEESPSPLVAVVYQAAGTVGDSPVTTESVTAAEY